MQINVLLRDLEEARRRYNAAKEDVEMIRNKIAVLKCPLSVGDVVGLTTKDSNDFEGIVESIGAKPDWGEAISGHSVEWIASGKRINKTTGETGQWSFSISSDESTIERGRWRAKTLNETLEISA